MPHPRYNTDQRPEDGSLPVFSAIWYIPYIPSLYSFTIFIYLTDALKNTLTQVFSGISCTRKIIFLSLYDIIVRKTINSRYG